MDKQQAQRAVFQLRRKAVNSAKGRPVVNSQPTVDLLPGERVDFKKLKPTQAWCRKRVLVGDSEGEEICGNAIPCRKHDGMVCP